MKERKEIVKEMHFETGIYQVRGFEVTTRYDDMSGDMVMSTISISSKCSYGCKETITITSKDALHRLIKLLQHVETDINFDVDYWGE